jgi:hypothetical protein
MKRTGKAIDIIRGRLAEVRRDELRRAIEESEAEYNAGLCKTGTVDEIKTETVS